MVDEFDTPVTVQEMYGDWGIDDDDALELADRSLHPRPPTSLYDTFAELTIGQEHEVLDIGGRDSAQALDLAERFGCRVLSVDPVQYNIDLGTAAIAAHAHGQLVENRLGQINNIPAPDERFDAVFARDMLGHVEDLAGAFNECWRVLKPGGAVLIHEVFATDMLEANEAAWLCADLASSVERLDADVFEALAVAAGFRIESIDPIGSEWLEDALEAEERQKHLLRAAHFHRDRDRLLAEMGEKPYRVLRANNIWSIYRVIGKLEDRVYVFRRP